MSEEKIVLKFELPTPQTPGYLKRMKSAIEYNRRLKGRDPMDPEMVDDMVGFLLPYITEPKDREEARNLMYEDLTEEQFSQMMVALTGADKEEENPTVAETQSASSEQLEKVEKESSSQNGSP